MLKVTLSYIEKLLTFYHVLKLVYFPTFYKHFDVFLSILFSCGFLHHLT